MFCLYCGTDLPVDARFCSSCGKQQSGERGVGPGSLERIGAPPYAYEFFMYLKYATPEPSARFWARAARTAEPPNFFATMPLGTLSVFPEYLVFLTTSASDYADQTAASWALERAADAHEVYRLVNRLRTELGSLLLDLAESSTKSAQEKREREQIVAAIAGPNSFYIPLNQVREVETGKNSSNNDYLRVSSSNQDFLIHEQYESNPFDLHLSTVLRLAQDG